MKNTLFAAVLGSLVLSAPASAALAPNWERVVELSRVAQDPAVSTTMGNNLIESVRFVAQDEYQVSGGSCTVNVALETIPPPPHVIGARQFTIKVTGATGCPVGHSIQD